MGKKSIATRWFVNSFVVVAIILTVMAAALFFMLRQYYYGAVEQILQTEANIIAGVLTRYYETFGAVDPNEIRRSIEEFDKKNKMELMAINARGEVILTSSGFSPYETYDMPDFREALENPGGVGRYVGFFGSSDNAERYMAVSVMLPENQDNTYSAIRMVTSLKNVDSEIYTITLFVGLFSIAMLLLLLFLGLYFIRSIVSPLRQIGNTARRLAGGDFSVRINQTKNNDTNAGDEIYELCSVINDMADELETSEALKNDFISSVSHELRTPLTAIKGWSETVLELRDDETTEKGMNVIIAESDRLTRMVEELLDFSRIQGGTFTLHMEDISILDELSSAVMVYAERANREGITIVLEHGADQADETDEEKKLLVNADKHRIRQVFINIIDNAIKYSKRNSVIKVRTENDDKTISISIKDSGCGISKADLPKVKMKFFKANNTRRGSGIGLAIVDEIVTMHKGRLNINSEINKGTTVKVTLPLIDNRKEVTD